MIQCLLTSETGVCVPGSFGNPHTHRQALLPAGVENYNGPLPPHHTFSFSLSVFPSLHLGVSTSLPNELFFYILLLAPLLSHSACECVYTRISPSLFLYLSLCLSTFLLALAQGSLLSLISPLLSFSLSICSVSLAYAAFLFTLHPFSPRFLPPFLLHHPSSLSLSIS